MYFNCVYIYDYNKWGLMCIYNIWVFDRFVLELFGCWKYMLYSFLYILVKKNYNCIYIKFGCDFICSKEVIRY